MQERATAVVVVVVVIVVVAVVVDKTHEPPKHVPLLPETLQYVPSDKAGPLKQELLEQIPF